MVTQSANESVWVGSARSADALAAALATAVLILGLVAVHRRRVRAAIILGSLVVAALLVLELAPPWWARVAWPLMVAATAVLAVVLIALVVVRRGAVAAIATAAVSLLVMLGYTFSAIAQPALPVTVLILPGSDGKEEVVCAACGSEPVRCADSATASFRRGNIRGISLASRR